MPRDTKKLFYTYARKCFVTVICFKDFRFHLTEFNLKSELFVLSAIFGSLES